MKYFTKTFSWVRGCFIGNLLKVECDNKTVNLNEKYDEEKRQTVVEKLIWRAGIKDVNSKDRDKNNIVTATGLETKKT